MPTNEIRYLLRSPLPVTLRGGHLLQLGREPGRGLLITAPPDAPRDGGGAVAGTGVRGEALQVGEVTGSFYCVKCKDHRDATGEVSVNEKGTRIAKAKCPVCGTNLTRFLPKQA